MHFMLKSARTCDIVSAMKKTQTLYQWASITTSHHNGRARKLGAPGKLTARDWIDCLRLAKGKCPTCNRVVGWWKLSLDHIVALADGGANERENIRAICRSCNSKKHCAPIEIAESPEYCSAREACDIRGGKVETIRKMVRRG